MAQNPRRLDGRTLVVLGSKSGTTPEIVAAAEFLKSKPVVTVGLTQLSSSPLARAVERCFAQSEKRRKSLIGMAMIAQSLIGGLLAARDGWPHTEALLSSLSALPDAFSDTAVAQNARGAKIARDLANDRNIYLLASGPGFTNAYVFGVCILMEMLWLHSYPIEAAEFFHGPFEIVERNTPLILILGEDPSRPLMERVVRFCEKHSDRLFIYDFARAADGRHCARGSADACAIRLAGRAQADICKSLRSARQASRNAPLHVENGLLNDRGARWPAFSASATTRSTPPSAPACSSPAVMRSMSR